MIIKREKGITLLALIITIIIILILSTVTISIMLEENGILKKTEEGKEYYKIAEYIELLTNVAVGDEIDRIVGGLEPDIEKLNDLINEEKYVANTEQDLENNIIRVTTVDGYILDVTIKGNGDVEVIPQGKDDGEPYPQIDLSVELSSDYRKAIITAEIEESKNGITKVELVGHDSKTYEKIKDAITVNYEVETDGTYTIRATSSTGKIRQRNIKITGIRDILNEDGLIEIKEPTWSNGYASTEIIKTEPVLMQYQINGTAESGWIEYKEPLKNLNYNDIIYARLYINGKGGKITKLRIDDKIAPTVQASIGQITTNSIEIKGVTATDKESGMDSNFNITYSYKKASEENYKEAISTSNTSYIYDGLIQDTTYHFKVTIKDRAGNIAEKVLNSTTASLGEGETTLKFGTPSWSNGKASITISKLSSSNPGNIQYQVNGTKEGNWTQYTSSIENLKHDDVVYARLWDGINSGSTATFTILDSDTPTAPTIAVSEGTAGTNSWYTSDVIVKITPGTDKQSGVSKTTYTITGAEEKAEIEVSPDGLITIKEEGINTVTAYTYDNSGKKSVAKTLQVKKDSIAPEPFECKLSNMSSNGFTITATTTDSNSGINKYEYYVDDTKRTSNVISGLALGKSYKVRVRAYDNAGNYIDSSEISTVLYSTSIDASTYRGNNGERYQIAICGSNSGSVWGTDVYTDDSNIAKAAVHAGIVKIGENKIVTIEIMEGRSSYTSSTRNGITTSSFGTWPGSYRFVE